MPRDSVTAADIYSATFMALLRLLPESVCTMKSSTRKAFALRGFGYKSARSGRSQVTALCTSMDDARQ